MDGALQVRRAFVGASRYSHARSPSRAGGFRPRRDGDIGNRVLEIATAFIVDIALIQRPNPCRKDYDTAWTLNIAVGAGCAAVMAALAYPAAAFYNEPRLAPIMFVLAGSWFVPGFENIGIVNFRREMDFAREFRFLISKEFVGFIVTVSLALALQSYWALIAGTVLSPCRRVLSYGMQPFRPRFSLAASRALFSFSGWLLLNNILRRSCAGRFRVSLSDAYMAPKRSGFIRSVLKSPFCLPRSSSHRSTAPSFPGMLGWRRMQKHFMKGSTAVIPVILTVLCQHASGLAVIAEPLVKVMLGNKWLDAIPVVETLAFCGVIVECSGMTSSTFIALGKQWVLVLLLAAHLIVLLPFLMIVLGQKISSP